MTEEDERMIMAAILLTGEAKDLVDSAVRDTEHELEYLSYARYGLDTVLGLGNPYNKSLETIITDQKETS